MKKQNKSLEKALKLIKRKKIIIDAQFLNKIEAAENGDLCTCFSLAIDFTCGTTGFKKDYDIAMYYMDKLKKAHCKSGDHERALNVLYQDALIEDRFKQYNAAMKKYERALKYMVANLPPRKWDYELLKTMSGIKYFVENQPIFEST